MKTRGSEALEDRVVSPREPRRGFATQQLSRIMKDGFIMPRVDRLATLYFTFPLTKLFSRDGTSVPILMYHSVSDNLFGKSHPYYQINTAPQIFARQMKWLRKAGYKSLTVSELQAALEIEQIPEKAVVITFDDGYQDFYTDAFASLHEHGLTATVFLATSRIQNTPARVEGVDYLTWAQVRELHRGGIEFGSHTVSHPDLRSLGTDEIEYEIGFSKEIIEEQLGAKVRTFAYPFAFPEEDRTFTRFLVDVLEIHGFDAGVSTILGRAGSHHNRFCLPRLPVNSWDDERLFRAKLEGGYDWLHSVQFLHKFIHHNVPLMLQRDLDITAGR